MPKNTVDIIIPAHNGGRYLKQAIDSALAQTYQDLSILVIDDGSTDSTGEIVESYKGRVGYFYQERTGAAGARNAGIRQSTGEYICFLDADDLMLPSRVEEQKRFLESDSSVDLVHSKVLVFRFDHINHPFAETYRPHQTWEDYLEPLCIVCLMSTSSVMIRRRAIEVAGMFPQDMVPFGEDWMFWVQCFFKGLTMAYLPKTHTLYRQHPGSMTTNLKTTVGCDTEVIRRTAKMFDANRVADVRKRTILSYGILSIAIRWLELGEKAEFDALVRMSGDVMIPSGPNNLFTEFSILAEKVPPSVLNLYLSKKLLAMDMPGIAAAILLRCGDFRLLQKEAAQTGQDEMFKSVIHSMEELLPEPGNSKTLPQDLGKVSAPSNRTDQQALLELEQTLPRHASLYDHLGHQLGLLAESRGNLLLAEKRMRDSVALNPNYSWTRYDLGRVLAMKGKYREAPDQIRQALILNRIAFVGWILDMVDQTILGVFGRRFWVMKRRVSAWLMIFEVVNKVKDLIGRVKIG